jgi:hypothetical protein
MPQADLIYDDYRCFFHQFTGSVPGREACNSVLYDVYGDLLYSLKNLRFSFYVIRNLGSSVSFRFCLTLTPMCKTTVNISHDQKNKGRDSELEKWVMLDIDNASDAYHVIYERPHIRHTTLMPRHCNMMNNVITHSR